MTSVTPNPWGTPNKESEVVLTERPISFSELMSEDLAKALQSREEESYYENVLSQGQDEDNMIQWESNVDTSSDLLLAHMLQQEYYKEHDSQITREEKHFNKNSKLSISFDNFRLGPELEESSDDEYSHDLDDENRVLDSFEERQRNDPVIPSCGYTRHNNKIVTKHDRKITGRKNAERVMNFPPCINTGDGGSFEMMISNRVFNKLQRTALSEEKRKRRIKDKADKATTDKVLDPKTRLIVYKMVNGSILESVDGVISTGKESVVFHAFGGSSEELSVPGECALKVFKTCLIDFKTRERYIRNDYRFKDRLSKNNNKKMMKLWAEKEFHNLRRLQKAEIPSPEPVLIKKHVLVMSFIGKDRVAALKLKHIKLSFAEWCVAYEQVVEIMDKMFHACKLVHSDMSEYNILWHEDKCWVIDVSQAVEPQHPNALKFLLRDCSNIIGFFKSKGLVDLPTPMKLFKKITGLNISDGDPEHAERLVEEHESSRELWKEGMKAPNDNFEFLWKEIQKREQVAILNEEEDTSDSDSEVEGSAVLSDDLGSTEEFCVEERSSEASQHPLDPLGSEHPLDPLESEHPLDPLGSEHPLDPLGSEHPLDPLGSEHPLHPLGSEHPLDPLGSEARANHSNPSCPDSGSGSKQKIRSSKTKTKAKLKTKIDLVEESLGTNF